MRYRLLAVLAAFAVAGIAPAPPHTLAGPPGSGHAGPSASVVPPTETEARFDAGLSPDSLRAWMKHLTSKPHHTGSPGSKEAAEYIARKTPGAVVVEVTPEMFVAACRSAFEMGVPYLLTGNLLGEGVDFRRTPLVMVVGPRGSWAFEGQHRHGKRR